MKINFSKVLTTVQGEPIKVEGKILELKDACITCLMQMLPSDQEDGTGKAAFDRLELARRINAGGEIEITAAEALLIQGRAPKAYGTLVSGQIYELLNG
jgi:hypothetical protein